MKIYLVTDTRSGFHIKRVVIADSPEEAGRVLLNSFVRLPNMKYYNFTVIGTALNGPARIVCG